MKRILAAVLFALGLVAADPSPALAATTWLAVTLPGPDYRGSRSVIATPDSGTETALSGIGTTTAPVGMSFVGVASFVVELKAINNAQTVAAGYLRAYYYDGTDWVRMPDMDITVSATAALGYAYNVSSPGIGAPLLAGGWGRIAYLPDGVTWPAAKATITIWATSTSGGPL